MPSKQRALQYTHSAHIVGSKKKLLSTPAPISMKDIVHPYCHSHLSYIRVIPRPQEISIVLGLYGAYKDITKTLYSCVGHYVDTSHPFKIKARFEEHQWTLEDGFRVLGRLLSFLGHEELLDFGLWQNLEIELPNRALPFNRFNSSELPLANFTKLRQLTWTGHPKQILDSWLPLTPSLLPNLEILTITSDITSHDFAYILRQANRLETLSLQHIRRDSMSMSVTPLINYCSRQRYPVTALKNLTVVSDEDICIVLDQFYFPSLLSLTLELHYPAFQSNFHDLESFNWGVLERFEFWSDLWNADTANFNTILSSEAEFSPHHGGHTVSWATTLPTL
ncbi:hypothetical protein H2248_010734 [Termitomyces sp. 'cryptogamus']|nr:hypothetical protein H2248_010734 [Termitomyces sp. 'cryptogamus']